VQEDTGWIIKFTISNKIYDLIIYTKSINIIGKSQKKHKPNFIKMTRTEKKTILASIAAGINVNNDLKALRRIHADLHYQILLSGFPKDKLEYVVNEMSSFSYSYMQFIRDIEDGKTPNNISSHIKSLISVIDHSDLPDK
jgi:hypothetical protein